MQLDYGRYLDKIYGGWLGKCIGGTIGARFEGQKHWIEVGDGELFPETVPPNDDLDIPVLWLKVLEEKGAAVRADDLAEAWLAHCWYPFCEYGNFRRNWSLGIHPPTSGVYNNPFYDTGMGCSIRSELWGYTFPGAPSLAARYAAMDGGLDHGSEAIAVEQMLAAMASLAFFTNDIRRLMDETIHYLPSGTHLRRIVDLVRASYEEGLSLRDARERYLLLGGQTEACDAHSNVPIIFLALLYGEGDMEKTMRSGLACGYDTDSTLATSGAFIGQILGAKSIPSAMKDPIGDELVMGIEYQRPEMTLSALARDTARMGLLFARTCATDVHIENAPAIQPLPSSAEGPSTWLRSSYAGRPCAAPGDRLEVRIEVEGALPGTAVLSVRTPEGWSVTPESVEVGPLVRSAAFTVQAAQNPADWPMQHLFHAELDGAAHARHTFGVAGAGIYRLLGVFFDTLPEDKEKFQFFRFINHHFASLDRDYLPEPDVDAEARFVELSRILGKPAIIPSYEYEVDPGRLIGLRGAYCAYLTRTIISDRTQPATITIGNTNPFRLYLNGELAAENRERLFWAPWNNFYEVTLRKGRNTLLLKLVKAGDDFRFTLGLKSHRNPKQALGIHCKDWFYDLKDEV